MSASSQREASPVIILVRPQLGENIGAVARAMSNFGLHELRLVAPKNGWPNQRAYDMATNAAPILDRIQLFSSVASALTDIHTAFASTARPRGMEKPTALPVNAMGALHARIAGGERCALLFGPERTGLANEDIALCDSLVTIPAHPANTSLNLAQSMVILGYEWWKTSARMHDSGEPHAAPCATKGELQEFFGQLESCLDAANHYRAAHKKDHMWLNLRNIFIRAQMNGQEVRTMRGVVRTLWEDRTTRSKNSKKNC